METALGAIAASDRSEPRSPRSKRRSIAWSIDEKLNVKTTFVVNLERIVPAPSARAPIDRVSIKV